jgi:hypothetical protein
MKNTNCLADIKCPKCGNKGQFKINANATFSLTDDGIIDYADVDWDDDSQITCVSCNKTGKIKEFKK